MAQEGGTTEERRGSFGRTFSKIKDAVRRRSLGGKRKSISEEVPTATTEEGSSLVQPADTTENALSPIQADDQPLVTENIAMADDSPLVVDDDYTGDYDYSTGPLHSIRSRIASARAKAVFDKYGIKYEEGDRQLEDGSKRVEKAIRIRIHWECHACKASFSGRRTCAKCGHKRCPDCARAPAKRVKEVLGGTKVMEEIEKKAENAGEEKDSVVVPITTGQEAAPAPTETAPVITEAVTSDRDADSPEVLTGTAAEEAIPDVEVQGTLEKDEVGEDGEIDVTQFQYTMQTRPRAGVQLVLRPKAQYIRRTCHECQTNFKPSSRHKCLNCGHDRCKRCPREPAKYDKWPWGSPGDADAPGSEQRMVGTVERVYKKARQRIRWACHECQTVFIGRTDCSKCGHARCEKCLRTPLAKVAPAAPDPAILASVAEKLAKLKGPSSEQIVLGPETATAAA